MQQQGLFWTHSALTLALGSVRVTPADVVRGAPQLGYSPNKRGENHISCMIDNGGQENARTILENAIIVLI